MGDALALVEGEEASIVCQLGQSEVQQPENAASSSGISSQQCQDAQQVGQPDEAEAQGQSLAPNEGRLGQQSQAAQSEGQLVQQSPSVSMASDDRKTIIEGATVSLEKHGQRAERGHYERLLVRCPLHRGCKAQRSFSARFMQASGLDNLEPYAFIGCWLQRRGQFSSAQAHVAWKPSKEDVVAYAQAQEWVSMAS